MKWRKRRCKKGLPKKFVTFLCAPSHFFLFLCEVLEDVEWVSVLLEKCVLEAKNAPPTFPTPLMNAKQAAAAAECVPAAKEKSASRALSPCQGQRR